MAYTSVTSKTHRTLSCWLQRYPNSDDTLENCAYHLGYKSWPEADVSEWVIQVQVGLSGWKGEWKYCSSLWKSNWLDKTSCKTRGPRAHLWVNSFLLLYRFQDACTSAAFLAAYMIEHHMMTCKQAISTIRRVKPLANPNSGCRFQLEGF